MAAPHKINEGRGSGKGPSQEDSDLLAKYLRSAPEYMTSAAAPPPPPPRWPMLSGVFTFPWYLDTLGPWMGISMGLIVTGLLLVFLWGPAAQMGLLAVRLLGPPIGVAGALTFSYAAACSFSVIENTFHGWDAIDEWPDLNWKEWGWSGARLIALLLQAGLAGLALQIVTMSFTWLLLVAGTLAAFPVVLLGALAADAAWFPLAILPVLRSLAPLGRTWALFYVETTVLIAGWTILTLFGLATSPWWTPLYSGPILAAVALIYARLVGRLGTCIAREQESRSDE